MKSALPLVIMIIFGSVFALLSCQKKIITDNSDHIAVLNPADTSPSKSDTELSQFLPFPQSSHSNCSNSPNYGDSVVFATASTSDQFIYPVNNQSIKGTYWAWPGGLVIDSLTGAVDVTQSENGQRYGIAFVPYGGSTDTCISELIIAGAAYPDSIYNAQLSKKSSNPLFPGSSSQETPCQDDGCQFDYTNSAKTQGVYIDKHKGVIDIKGTLDHSIFAASPADGTFFYSTIYYKLNTGNNALQNLQVKFIYYNSRSSVPVNLVQNITARASDLVNATFLVPTKTRPPLIIITRNN